MVSAGESSPLLLKGSPEPPTCALTFSNSKRKQSSRKLQFGNGKKRRTDAGAVGQRVAAVRGARAGGLGARCAQSPPPSSPWFNCCCWLLGAGHGIAHAEGKPVCVADAPSAVCRARAVHPAMVSLLRDISRNIRWFTWLRWTGVCSQSPRINVLLPTVTKDYGHVNIYCVLAPQSFNKINL